jgi:hypothetical protein
MSIKHKQDLPHPPAVIHETRSDMEAGMSSGQGEAVSTTVAVDTASVTGCRRGGGERVGIDALSV